MRLMGLIVGTSFQPTATLLMQGLQAEVSSAAFDTPRSLALIAGSASASSPHWFQANESHRSFLSEARAGLASSILAPELREPVARALDAAQMGAIPAGRASDLLWQALALDFFTAIPGSALSYDARNRILEFRCKPTFLRDPTYDRLRAVGKFLNLSCVLYEETGHEAIVRIPTLSFLEDEANRLAMEALFGSGGSAQWSYALGEMLRDDYNREHLEGRQAVALPLTDVYLSHAGSQVHPFIFAMHDVYHAVLVATLPAPLRYMAAGLYEAIRGLPPELRGLPFVEPMMDFLSDKELPRGSTDDLMNGAFLYLRDDIRRNQASDLHRRFVAEMHAAWEPFVHESRRVYVAAYLKNLLP